MVEDDMESVPDVVRARARETPAREALVASDETVFSYAVLDEAVGRTAGRLHRAGVGEGDRVACYLPRTAAYVTLLWALLRCGAAAVPLSTRQPPGRLGAFLASAGARVLVVEREADGAGAAVEEATEVCEADSLVVAPEAVDGEAAPDDRERLDFPVDRPATIVFTSGSTGGPKAALLTVGNHFYSAAGSNRNIALDVEDRWLLSLPLYHVGGLAILFRCFQAGGAVALPAPDEEAGAALRRTGATHASLVPTQLRRLLQEDRPLKRTKALLLGGAALPEALLEAAHRRGWPLYTSYGLTEMASQVTTTPPGASPAELKTAGRLLSHRQLRVDESGELLVRGRTRFAGYVRGGTLHRPFDEGGWFATGDRGQLTGDGWLEITGRQDRQFISGGENIQPEEIEAALNGLEDVGEAIVVPVPDEEFGARPVAFVRPTAGSSVPSSSVPSSSVPSSSVPSGLRERLAETVPAFKIPVAFYPWPEGRDGRMKTDRHELRREARRRRGG